MAIMIDDDRIGRRGRRQAALAVATALGFGLLLSSCLLDRQGRLVRDAEPPPAAPDANGVDSGAPLDAGPTAMDAGPASADSGGVDAGDRIDSGLDGAVVGGPTDASGPLRILQVTAGGAFTCALRSDSAVLCWGANDLGQLGDGGDAEATSTPRVVPLPAEEAFTQVSAGTDHACARAASGNTYCWGDNSSLQLALDSSTEPQRPRLAYRSAAFVAAGGRHTCVIDQAGGEVLCWGGNGEGQVNGTPGDDVAAPTVVPSVPESTFVTLGGMHSCAIGADALLRCWGASGEGQLGQLTDSNSPDTVVGLAGVTAAGAGALHTCAVHAAGTSCWGKGSDGRLGNGSSGKQTTPVPVTGLTDGADVDGGLDHTCALRTGGQVSCWGKDDREQVAGTGNQSLPTDVGLSGVEQIAVGGQHNCVLVEMEVRCWGDNASGQLGRPAGSPSSAIEPVSGLLPASG